MIVMKFGGSSLESSEAVSRVCGIVKTHQKRRPVVVVSAVGNTTNQLLDLASDASKGRGYLARKHLNQIQNIHFRIADDLLQGERLAALTQSFKASFRELHGLVHDLSEEGGLRTAIS